MKLVNVLVENDNLKQVTLNLQQLLLDVEAARDTYFNELEED